MKNENQKNDAMTVAMASSHLAIIYSESSLGSGSAKLYVSRYLDFRDLDTLRPVMKSDDWAAIKGAAMALQFALEDGHLIPNNKLT